MRTVEGGAGLVCALLTIFSCKAEPRDPDYPMPALRTDGELVVAVGPVRFTRGEIEGRINEQSPFLRERLRDPERRLEFVDQAVQFELLAQEAWQRKLHQDPTMVEELKKKMVQKLLNDEINKRLKGQEVDEAVLRTEFVKRRDEYQKPARVRISQIVRHVSDAESRARERRSLEELRDKILGQEKKNDAGAFATAAQEHSQDEASKGSGGDLQFLTREEIAKLVGEAVAEQIFDQAKVGDMQIVDTDKAVVLFRKTGLRRAVERTLEMVKPQLRAIIMRERKNAAIESFLDELKKAYHVEVDRAVVERLHIEGGPSQKEGGGQE